MASTALPAAWHIWTWHSVVWSPSSRDAGRLDSAEGSSAKRISIRCPYLKSQPKECPSRSTLAARSCLSSSGSWETHDFLKLLYGLRQLDRIGFIACRRGGIHKPIPRSLLHSGRGRSHCLSRLSFHVSS